MASSSFFAPGAGLRVALSQLNPTVGDLVGNESKVVADYARAEAEGCHVVVFPELTVTGYPPEDLLLKKSFVRHNRLAVERIAAATNECVAAVGFIDNDDDTLYNAVALCSNGGIVGIYRKQLLPNYSVFDEERYFTPGE